ncbi:HlyD family secretion protein [Vibrio salinus]|uniref:HlyD family secretion protein n=1 Tax=Vibrio salinus TaxID=2899784 RepID=UPI001E45B7D1|nr:efflux RND transporter periplasmic adaptor subunit [Vibrio salinus]MCE0495899.1 efflux RND transporter periplasmic adaptor subunit [Vibrio salinus]
MQEKETEQTVSPNKSKRKKGLTTFALIIAIAALGSGYYYFNYVRGNETTEDAYVNGNLVQITPEITGTVTSIAVDDGDYVKKGQVLVRFDKDDAQIAYESAVADLGQTVRQVRTMFNSVTQAKAVVETRRIALNKAKTDYSRRKDMVKVGGLSQEELSHAKDLVDSAQKELAVAIEQLKAKQSIIHGTTVETHPLVRASVANLKKAYLAKIRTSVVAPVSGYVARRNVQLGQRVSQNSVLMAVVPLDDVWVDANFKETQLREMRIGQPVSLISDLYGDDVVFHGKVESLGIGTGSAFSLLPAQNATGNWIKVVQRLPVRIELDKKELKNHPLRIGLSMTADVETENTNGPLLSVSSPKSARYKTDVYSRSNDNLNKLVARIIAENDAQLKDFIAKK